MNVIKLIKCSLLVGSCFFIFACSNAKQSQKTSMPAMSECKNSSSALQQIVNDDQQDREVFLRDDYKNSMDKLMRIMKHDQTRREKVAIIFAKGCFNSAQDYANAAMVFQHGSHADHYYQTYIWAKKAASLGEDKANGLLAEAVDRYLIATGYKQVFGTQGKMSNPGDEYPCYCIQPTEKDFPQSTRDRYFGKFSKDLFILLSKLNHNNGCSIKECSTSLKPVTQPLLRKFGFDL